MEPHNEPRDSILRAGLARGWSGALWMFKIILPISFLTLLLETSGLMAPLEGWLAPAMGWLQLPARAALPLIVGLLTGIYGAIAALAVMGLNEREMTLVAVFVLISHNLVQESAVQGRSGLHPVPAALWRLGASVAAVTIIGWLWPVGGEAARPSPAGLAVPPGFAAAVGPWALETAGLCGQIVLILTAIMVLLEWMRRRNHIARVVAPLRPLLRFMGLDERVGILWLTANLFGLTYGAAVIVEEAGRGEIPAGELARLQVSVGINHSLVEDPAVFLPLGLHAFWLWVPRLAAAVVAVRLLNLWQRLRRGRRGGAPAGRVERDEPRTSNIEGPTPNAAVAALRDLKNDE